MTDTEADPAEAADKETTPGQEANKILYRAIARALARTEAGEGELKAKWNEGRAKYINDARKLAKALRKERVTLTVEPKTGAKASADPED